MNSQIDGLAVVEMDVKTYEHTHTHTQTDIETHR
jgi:hypothetical protein